MGMKLLREMPTFRQFLIEVADLKLEHEDLLRSETDMSKIYRAQGAISAFMRVLELPEAIEQDELSNEV